MYGTTVALNPTYFIGMDLHSNNVVVCVLQMLPIKLDSSSRKSLNVKRLL